jgi:hypothetical protein
MNRTGIQTHAIFHGIFEAFANKATMGSKLQNSYPNNRCLEKIPDTHNQSLKIIRDHRMAHGRMKRQWLVLTLSTDHSLGCYDDVSEIFGALLV